MGMIKNYLLATAGLVILGGAVYFVMPLQAAPPAKEVSVVEYGDMIITLVDGQNAAIELDAVDVSGFRYVSFHGKADAVTNFGFRFSTQAGKLTDDIPKTGLLLTVV